VAIDMWKKFLVRPSSKIVGPFSEMVEVEKP